MLASARGETVRVIEEAECGFCSEIGDAEGLASNIRNALKTDIADLGIKSREYFEKFFDKQKLMDEMDKYLGKVDSI